MFCRHCGTQIPDGSEKCPSCGGELAKKPDPAPETTPSPQPAPPQPSAPQKPDSAVKELAGTVTDIAAERTKGLPLGLIAKVCVLIAMVAFLFPFVSVSCTEDKTVHESYSGLRLMLSIEKSNDSVAGQTSSEPRPNFLLIVTFAGAAATAVILFRKNDLRLGMIISAISAAALLLFRLTFRSYYDLTGDYADYIKVKTKFGFVLCLLMLLCTAAACLLERKNKGESSPAGK
ncbi:MAG: zinc-ribbon domain-containing protein [Ruminococcus sp.]|nr:zinc-ribbon domain-containing protein [Ruminococcus sp.]